MSATTGIAWCDSTLNFWAGCTKVSPACDHCYAERDSARFKFAEWGAGNPRKQMAEATRAQAEKWNQKPFFECGACGWRGEKPALTSSGEALCWSCCAEPSTLKSARRRVFVNSWSDWLDNEVPIEWLVDLLDRIRRCPNIDFLLLTKRVGNWPARLKAVHEHLWATRSANNALRGWVVDWHAGEAPANVWLGATVVNQSEADRDVPKLLAVPARVRFLSMEPLLGPVDLKEWIGTRPAIGGSTYTDSIGVERCDLTGTPVDGIDWIIPGGESGPHARPSHPDWYRSLRDQCAAAGVPFLFKQHGEWLATDFCSDADINLPSRRTVYVSRDGSYVDGSEGFDFFAGYAETAWVGKKAAGRLLDGVEHNQFPAVSA